MGKVFISFPVLSFAFQHSLPHSCDVKNLVACFLFSSLSLGAQTIEEDSAAYRAALDWVERKLTFNYYDNTNQHFWVNRFHLNDNGSITTKNIASENPNKVVERNFHNRTFFLHDLNPRTISVIDIPSDQGRFVKGKIVRVEGFQGEKKVSTSHDGVVGSNLNYIHISIPAFLEDSLQNYALEVKKQLSDLAFLNARLANRGDLNDNLEKTFSVFSGKYISQDSTTTLTFVQVEPRLVRFELRDGEKLFFGMVGYDQKSKTLYLLKSGSDEYVFLTFSFDHTTRNLVLRSKEDELFLVGRNTFKVKIGDWQDTYFRY